MPQYQGLRAGNEPGAREDALVGQQTPDGFATLLREGGVAARRDGPFNEASVDVARDGSEGAGPFIEVVADERSSCRFIRRQLRPRDRGQREAPHLNDLSSLSRGRV